MIRRSLPRPAARFVRAALLVVFSHQAVAQGAIELEAPEDVAALLRRYLSVFASDHPVLAADDNDRLALVRRLRREAEDLLATEGYFRPRVELLDAPQGGGRLVVTPGERTRIARVDLRISESADLTPAERSDWLARFARLWPLRAGDAFRQSLWDAGKTALVEDMSRRVFAAARIADSRAEVDAEAASAVLLVEVDPGPRFVLGPLRVDGLARYDLALVERFSPPQAGEPYDAERLLAFQAELQNTPYFSTAIVDIDRESADPGHVPLRVLLSEARPRRVSVGAGFSTNTGYRVETGYRDANLFDRAWHLVGGVRIEQRNQLAFADVFLPPAHAGHRDSMGAMHERNNLEGLRLSREAVGVTRSYPLSAGELGLAIKYQRERTRPDGAESSEQNALTADASLSWASVNDVLNPRKGYVALVKLGGTGKSVLSDQTFVRAYGRLQVYLPVGVRDVLSLRGEVGKTLASSRDGIPQDFLFRAGGAQSVRGYAYRSLGVSEGDAVVGGRYLATMAAEYTHWRTDGWGFAAFVDAGNAVDERSDFRLLPGYGLGLRWKSPAGPLALDLAYGQEDRRTRLHFSILIAY